ncbi:MAG: glycosyltransferase [Acidimicrobiales bacterium]
MTVLEHHPQFPCLGTPNSFHVFDGDLRSWDLDDGAVVAWPECRYFRDVLAAFDRGYPSKGLRFVLTDRVNRVRALAGPDVVVICIKDELSRVPAYAHDVRLVGKTYGVRHTPDLPTPGAASFPVMATTLAQEGFVQARRLPSLAQSALHTAWSGRRPNVIDLPLGTYLLRDEQFVPFSERPFDVSYVGSRTNRPGQSERLLPTRKMRSRLDLEQSIAALRLVRPQTRLVFRAIESFREARVHSATFSRALMQSRIALCPRGGSLETYRFFEALRSGTIPVCERLPERSFYSGSPAVTVRDWSDLPAVVDRLLADPIGLEARHRAVLAWWEQRCSPAAVARQLAVALSVDRE